LPRNILDGQAGESTFPLPDGEIHPRALPAYCEGLASTLFNKLAIARVSAALTMNRSIAAKGKQLGLEAWSAACARHFCSRAAIHDVSAMVLNARVAAVSRGRDAGLYAALKRGGVTVRDRRHGQGGEDSALQRDRRDSARSTL
jgi:hypothetical protein